MKKNVYRAMTLALLAGSLSSVGLASQGGPVARGGDPDQFEGKPVIQLLAGEEAVATDPSGDQSAWVFLIQGLASQAPVVSGNTVSVKVPWQGLLGLQSFKFLAAAFGSNTTLDQAPNNQRFAPWVSSATKSVADPVDPAVSSGSDLRSATVGKVVNAQVPFSLTTRTPPTSGTGAVFNFTFDVGGKFSNVTFRRYSASVWDFYLYKGDFVWPWVSGGLHDIVKATVQNQGADTLKVSVQLAAPIPAVPPASAGRPFYNFYITGGRVTFRWNGSAAKWEAVLRKLGPGGIYVDVATLPLTRSGATFSTTVTRSALGITNGISWYVGAGAEAGPTNDLLFNVFDFAPNGSVVQQP